MSATPRFCTKCGAGLAEGARFCAKCGVPAAGDAASPVATREPAASPEPPELATPAPDPAPPAAPTPGEHIHAIIPNATLKQGFLGAGSKPHILILTDRRIVFVRITNEMMKQMVADARDSAKAEGKGFFGQWGAQLGAPSSFAQRYLEMDPAQALAETPENFALERRDIQSAKLKAGHTDENGQTGQDRLIIKAAGKKYDLSLTSGRRQAKEALIAAALI